MAKKTEKKSKEFRKAEKKKIIAASIAILIILTMVSSLILPFLMG